MPGGGGLVFNLLLKERGGREKRGGSIFVPQWCSEGRGTTEDRFLMSKTNHTIYKIEELERNYTATPHRRTWRSLQEARVDVPGRTIEIRVYPDRTTAGPLKKN